MTDFTVNLNTHDYTIDTSKVGLQGATGNSVSRAYIDVNNNFHIEIKDAAGAIVEDINLGGANYIATLEQKKTDSETALNTIVSNAETNFDNRVATANNNLDSLISTTTTDLNQIVSDAQTYVDNKAAEAAASASTATNKATTATNKANAAAASASAAAASASAAADSEINSAASATAAALSEENAYNYSITAGNHASAAQAAKDQTLSLLDNFDDRYLGQKASAPTVDNDGYALVNGALYFDTTDDIMRVWEGSQWVAAYASLEGTLLIDNNLSDVENVSTARTNLGLGSSDSPEFANATFLKRKIYFGEAGTAQDNIEWVTGQGLKGYENANLQWRLGSTSDFKNVTASGTITATGSISSAAGLTVSGFSTTGEGIGISRSDGLTQGVRIKNDSGAYTVYCADGHAFRNSADDDEWLKIDSSGNITANNQLNLEGGVSIETGGWNSNGLTLTGAAPSIYFNDSDGDNVHIGVNNGTLFVLHDPTGDGSYTGANPFQLNLSTGLTKIRDKTVYKDDYHPYADALTTPVNITLDGAVSGTTSFDGSGDVSITTTVDSSSHNHDDLYFTETESDDRYLRSTVANANDMKFSNINGLGLNFYNSDMYSVYMSATDHATHGGSIIGDSDYNMYFKMGNGVDRGFVFKSGNTAHTQIRSDGSIFTKGSKIVAGVKNGGPAMTTNDGYGNANFVINHVDGTPAINGNAFRLEFNKDSVNAPRAYIEMKTNVVKDQAVQLDPFMSWLMETDRNQIELDGPSGTDGKFFLSSYGNTTDGAILGISNNAPMRFFINSAEVSRFTGDGKLGIGTSAPVDGIHLYQNISSSANIRLANNEGSAVMGSENNAMIFNTNGGSVRVLDLYPGGNAKFYDELTVSGLLTANAGVRAKGPVILGTESLVWSGDGTGNSDFIKWPTTVGLEGYENSDLRWRLGAGSSAGRQTYFAGNVQVGALEAADLSLGTQQGSYITTGFGIFTSVTSKTAHSVQRIATDGEIVEFYKDTSVVGNISVTAAGTSYNTTSDSRLKENIQTASKDSGVDVDAIQVREFDWKANGVHQDYGFIAQELKEVAPYAVSEGSTEEAMMSVDYSKLVPLMMKELQALRARVAELESSLI